MEDYLKPFRSVFEQATSPFSREVAFSAAENYVPLKQLFGTGKVKVVFYEMLVSTSRPAIEDVLNFVGRAYNKRLERVALRPSVSTDRSSPLKNFKKDMVKSWTNRCSRKEIEDGMTVLEAFGLDKYYNTEPLPAARQYRSTTAVGAALVSTGL